MNISPKIPTSAHPLKMALHKNPAMHGCWMVIFLHKSKKTVFFMFKTSAPFKTKSRVKSRVANGLWKIINYHFQDIWLNFVTSGKNFSA